MSILLPTRVAKPSLEVNCEAALHAPAGHQIILRVAKFAFRYGIAAVAEVAGVHADFPSRRAVSSAEVDGCEAVGERGIAFVQEPATGVVHGHAAQETADRGIVKADRRQVMR